MVQSKSTQLYVTASALNAVQLVTLNSQDPNQHFTYNPTSLQLHNPAQNICMKGFGYNSTLTYGTCDTTDITQQFILTTGHVFVNPNFPNGEVCVTGRNSLSSEPCTYTGLEVFNIVLVCSPGKCFSQ